MTIELTLNGGCVRLEVDPGERLLDTLRDRLGLKGTKEGCGEGECGACTVLMDGVPVNSCLVPIVQARGKRIETIESVDRAQLSALLDSGATQCGACTPGVVMSAAWVMQHPELLHTHGLRELMAGNLCRCTGYDGIIGGLAAAIEAGLARKSEGEG
ncbi:MAG: (2Fe-2S)-binding protein [Planctomycetota bacterium]|nr:MAG: (2Fe-2S)-binding protein [Planctomycetota bacterium]